MVLGLDGKPLYPWIMRVDIERLAAWLAIHMKPGAWRFDPHDLRASCGG
jgi:hypothetical protein